MAAVKLGGATHDTLMTTSTCAHACRAVNTKGSHGEKKCTHSSEDGTQ